MAAADADSNADTEPGYGRHFGYNRYGWGGKYSKGGYGQQSRQRDCSTNTCIQIDKLKVEIELLKEKLKNTLANADSSDGHRDH